MHALQDEVAPMQPMFEPGALIGARDFEDFLDSHPYLMNGSADKQAEDLQEMEEVVKRIRAQVRHIVHSVRCWRGRHGEYDHPVRLRYSAYEGALCYTDLRRHWSYYRHAMRELSRHR